MHQHAHAETHKCTNAQSAELLLLLFDSLCGDFIQAAEMKKELQQARKEVVAAKSARVERDAEATAAIKVSETRVAQLTRQMTEIAVGKVCQRIALHT